MRRSVKIVALIAGGLATAGLTEMVVSSLDPELLAHQRAAELVQKLTRLDLARSLCVMRVRYRLLNNYDEVVASNRLFDGARSQLDAIEARLEVLDPSLTASRVRAALAMDQKAELIEDFKTNSAVLRNSLSHLPTLVAELRGQVAADDRAQQVVLQGVEVLAQSLLQAVLDDSPALEASVAEARWRLESNSPRMVEGLATALTSFLTHAELVRRYQQRTEFVLTSLGKIPIESRLAEIGAWHSEQVRRIEARKSLSGWILALVGIVLAAVTLRLLLDLRRGRLHLEARIAERTRDLAVMNQSLMRASQTKTTFLANMSHEIRTPLTAILGYAELLDDQGDPIAGRQNYARLIRRNGEHLLAIINYVLDITKIEAGGLHLESVVCAPSQLVKEVCAWLHQRASGKGVELKVDVAAPGAAALRLRSDPTRLRQILINLVGNAIKFTPQGGVVLVSLRHEVRPTGDQVMFVVSDTGLGMTPVQLGRIFNDFVQGDTEIGRRFGGTGLGLAICKKVVKAMGGTIGVDSQPGQGSTFWVKLPAPAGDDLLSSDIVRARAPRALSAASAAARLPGMRILLADDSPDNQLLVSTILRAAGASVSVVSDGREAVDAALAGGQAGAPFSLILMDLQMPEMGGLEATAAIRAAGVDTPIVALSASVFKDDRAQCLTAGCAGFLTKPFTRDGLIQVVAELGFRVTARAIAVRAVAAPATMPSPAAAAPDLAPVDGSPGAAVFDVGRLDQATGGDAALVSALLELALTSGPAQLAEVAAALAGGKPAAVRQAAHKIKGSWLAICADRAAGAAAELERAAIEGRGADFGALFAGVERAAQELTRAITEHLGREGEQPATAASG